MELDHFHELMGTLGISSRVAAPTLGLLLLGCALILPSIRESTPVQLEHWPASTQGGDCGGVRIGTVELAADRNAEVGQQVWVVSDDLGQLWPVWPFGWTAAFTPELVIFDRQGNVVLTEGDTFAAGGSLVPEDTAQICEIDGITVL